MTPSVSAQTASVVLVAELGLLANAGFELATRSCAHCGAGVPPGKARFEPAAGGVVCTHCRDREAVARELSGGARAALSALEAADAANLPRLRPSTAQIQELRDLMHVIWLNILERPLKSAVFVRDRSFGFLRAARVARR